MIVEVELPPGSLVSERALMERVGVGRTPMREALQRLANENLVQVYPRRGMFISSVEMSDLAAISDVRAALESHAAALAAERASDEERVAIETLVEEVMAWRGRSQRQLMDLDRRIHRHIYQCAHNSYLSRTLEEYFALSLRIWHFALDRTPGLGAAVFEHRFLLEAIYLRRARIAEKLMREHVRDFEVAMRHALAGGA
jgi:DNA-binding GntR family transcriptional regulator